MSSINPPLPPEDDDPQVSWYFSDQGESIGPYTEEQMLAWAASGRFQDDTPVWSEGMADWAPWKKVSPWLMPAPPVDSGVSSQSNPMPRPKSHTPDPPAVDSGGSSSGSMGPTASVAPPDKVPVGEVSARTRQAWMRFAARSVDFLLVIVANELLSAFFGLQGKWIVIMFLACTLVWVFAEAWFLSRWGMTPGKWIFRIRVVHEEGRLLTFLEARHRATQVLLQGMGLNLFPFLLIFNALAFKELMEFGKTSWDRQRHMEIQMATMGPQHRVAAAAVALFMIILIAVLMK
jgi:hypothetical protein